MNPMNPIHPGGSPQNIAQQTKQQLANEIRILLNKNGLKDPDFRIYNRQRAIYIMLEPNQAHRRVEITDLLLKNGATPSPHSNMPRLNLHGVEIVIDINHKAHTSS